MIGTKSLRSRVARALLRISDSLGVVAIYNGRQVSSTISEITQSDLGMMARASRGAVNRVLKELEQKGLIYIKDRVILLVNRGALEECAYRG